MKLTERDRELCGVLALARYLSTAQVRRLFFPGRTAFSHSRRLLALAGERDNKEGAYLKRLQYRTWEGSLVHVWALTAAGYEVAERVIGGIPKVPRHDISAGFLEHTVMLNELLVALLETGTSAPASARQERFRWIPSEWLDLPFQEYEDGATRSRRLQPDAVLEMPGLRRRLFLEYETGSHTVTGSTDEGSTLSKIERYSRFLAGFADVATRTTWYARSYPDGYDPEVLFILASEGRRETVREAFDDWRKGRAGAQAVVRALTLGEVQRELLSLTRGRSGPPARENKPPSGALSEGDLAVLRGWYNAVVLELRTARHGVRRLRDQDRPVDPRELREPEYPAGTGEVQALLLRLGSAKPR